jgi:aryl-alcohol dehydrogenase-like predicted oxidoreductase
VVLATKFGRISHRHGGVQEFDGTPENLRVAVEGSLRRLGTDHIDLYYQHRVDPATPIEDTVGALRELGIGLVAYSPLGRGFLTGRIRSMDQFDPGDFRNNIPSHPV